MWLKARARDGWCVRDPSEWRVCQTLKNVVFGAHAFTDESLHEDLFNI